MPVQKPMQLRKRMNKFYALFLLFVYLLFSAGMSEFLKVNTLLTHYGETRKWTPSVCFFEFLVEHYLTDDGNPDDNATDSKLPFKSPGSHAASGLVFILSQFPAGVKSCSSRPADDYFSRNDSTVPTRFHSLVWHPPQAA